MSQGGRFYRHYTCRKRKNIGQSTGRPSPAIPRLLQHRKLNATVRCRICGDLSTLSSLLLDTVRCKTGFPIAGTLQIFMELLSLRVSPNRDQPHTLHASARKFQCWLTVNSTLCQSFDPVSTSSKFWFPAFSGVKLRSTLARTHHLQISSNLQIIPTSTSTLLDFRDEWPGLQRSS
jgi:hypothetical protein